MTLQEIKNAVDNEQTVIWKQNNYKVAKWACGYVVVCTDNNYAIGLTWQDGVTMNGAEEDFSIVPKQAGLNNGK